MGWDVGRMAPFVVTTIVIYSNTILQRGMSHKRTIFKISSAFRQRLSVA